MGNGESHQKLLIGRIDLKIYDCFTFYNEFELLELRLKSLWNMVELISRCTVPSAIENQVLTVDCQLLVPTSKILEYSAITLAQQHHHYYLDAVKNFCG